MEDIVWVDMSVWLLLSSKTGSGSSNHVVSVWVVCVVFCTETVGLPTTDFFVAACAYDCWPATFVCGLQSLRASGYDTFLSTFTLQISFSSFHLGHDFELGGWSPSQCMQCTFSPQFFESCPTPLHTWQAALPLQAVWWWPYFWHLKQRRGCGM